MVYAAYGFCGHCGKKGGKRNLASVETWAQSESAFSSKAALETGELSMERFESYEKLRKELRYEGLNARQLEQEKIRNMFGSMGEMKRAMRYAKNKNKRPK